ncbi:MAG TPA: class I SAM-dependent methyltransferase [Micromonosporaceae bacterium]
MSTYLFDNAGVPARARLDGLEYCFDKVTTSNIEGLGVSEGWNCLEVGGGNGSIGHWLADRVGPAGKVVATDIDTTLMRPAVGNLEIRHHDIVNDELEEAYYDLVHARLVLLHIPQRRQAVERIFRALKPGGYLLLEELDVTWHLPVLSAPDEASVEVFHKVSGGVHKLLNQAGMDSAWARTAYASLTESGYADLGYRGYCDVWRGGSIGASLHRANALQVADKLTANGLATEAELDAFLTLIEDPRFAVSSYLMLATWGRRPTGE